MNKNLFLTNFKEQKQITQEQIQQVITIFKDFNYNITKTASGDAVITFFDKNNNKVLQMIF